jgi:hypothetical protein
MRRPSGASGGTIHEISGTEVLQKRLGDRTAPVWRHACIIQPLNSTDSLMNGTSPSTSRLGNLSFAKNASTDMSLRGNAFRTVVQTAELRDFDDLSDTRHRPWEWALLVQPQMGPRSVVVSEIRSQGSFEMPGVENHEMVQAVSPYGTDQAFNVRICQGL